MKISRRFILKTGAASALFACIAGFAKSVSAKWPAASFETAAYDEAYAYVTGGEEPETSTRIKIDAPEIAGNGATVPVTVSTDMENVNTISVLVEKNPRPYIATFFMNDQIESSITARIKMRETSAVVAVIDTTQGKFIARQSVKVTAGGCV